MLFAIPDVPLWHNLVSHTTMANKLLSGINVMKIIKKSLKHSMLLTLLSVLSFIFLTNSLKLFAIMVSTLKNINITQSSLRCYLPLSLKLSKCLKTGVIAFYFLLDVTLLNVLVDTLLNSSTSFILRKKAWIIRLIHLIILLRIIRLGGLYG